MTKMNVQMYSLAKECKEDFKAALKLVSEMGYDGVEFAGYYGLEAEELKAYMDEIGLEAVSAHIGLQALKDDVLKEIKYLKTLGGHYITCPHTQSTDVKSAEVIGGQLKTIAEICEREGLPLLYHNHNHELKMDGDKMPLEILFESAPKMDQQIDVYFLQYEGLDVYKYVEKHKERIRSVHLKQIKSMEDKVSVDVASGMIDMKRVMAIVPDALFVYEHEPADESAVEGVRKSLSALLEGADSH